MSLSDFAYDGSGGKTGGIGKFLFGSLGSLFGQDQAKKQAKYQLAFAKNGIQWKVEDAKKAGIHPLYALGAPTMSFSPTAVGGSSWAGDAGQDISRAIGAGMSKEGQLSAYEAAVQRLNIEGMGLDNEYKAAQLARLRNEMLQKPALPPVGHTITGPGGVPFKTGDSTTSQVVQDDYGDLIENVYGTGRLIYDSFTNLDRLLGGKFLGSQWTKRGYPQGSNADPARRGNWLRRSKFKELRSNKY